MRKIAKIGLNTLGALLFMVGPVWATPFTSVVEGHFSSTFQNTNADFIVANLGAFSGFNTTLWEAHCVGVLESHVAEAPSGSSDGVEFVIVAGVNQSQFESGGRTDLLFYDNTEYTSCVPFACFDAGSLVVEGCSGTASGTAVVTGGTGIFEGATGSWTFTQEFTYTDVAPGGFPYAGTTSFESQFRITRDITFAGGDRAAGAVIEVPAECSNNSCIGNVSIWSCRGGDLEGEFSDVAGVINTLPIPHGAERLDVEATCGKNIPTDLRALAGL